MKKFLFFLIITSCFIACNAQKSTEQQKCEEAVASIFADVDYVPISFDGFNEANISIDSLRNTNFIKLSYNIKEMHKRNIRSYEERLGNCGECDEKLTLETDIAYEKELLAEAEQEIRNREALYTPKNYVIEHTFINSGESSIFRYYLNDNYQIISRTLLELNGKNVESVF